MNSIYISYLEKYLLRCSIGLPLFGKCAESIDNAENRFKF
jgi:hypothetical protein